MHYRVCDAQKFVLGECKVLIRLTLIRANFIFNFSKSQEL